MSLEDTIKELREQIAQQEEDSQEEQQEDTAPETEHEEPEQQPEEEPKQEEKAEEKPADGDNAAWARLRREAAAERKKALELAAELERLKSQRDEPEAETHEEAAMPPQLERLLRDQQEKDAMIEFQAYENDFRKREPQYDAVATEYVAALAQSIKIQNPAITQVELMERTKRQVLLQASELVRNGFDPVEEMYHRARELGFTGATQAKEQPKEEVVLKPDMKKVAENRKRSTGMGAARGESEATLTKQAAADLSIDEWSKLPASEKKRLLYSA